MRSKSALFLVASLFFSLAAQGATQQEIVAEYSRKEIDPRQIVITLERTACFGSCPSYRVTITGSGEVEYEGRSLVKIVGIRKGTLEKQEVLKLVDELLRAHFFDAASEYATRDMILSQDGRLTLGSTVLTDAPNTFLQVRIGKYGKRVRLYDNYPQELGAIPDRIDQAVDIEQWIGTYCERPRSSMGPPFQPGECGQ